MRQIQQKTRGFIATLSALALLTFSLSLTLAVTYLSVNESRGALLLAQGAAALALTEGCAEDALLLAIQDVDYTGGTVEYLGGSCVVAVAKNVSTWTFSVHGTKDVSSRNIEIEGEYTVGTPNTFVLTSWQER